MLEIGLGRALLYVKSHDATQYRDVILNACLHNLSYDRQVEGGREEYMFAIIKATPDFVYYANQIVAALQALTHEANDYDVEQQYNFVKLLARENFQGARQALYDKFNANMALADFAGADTIIELDGLDGFVHVAGRIGAAIREHGDMFPVGDHEYSADDMLILTLEESIGKEKATEALARLKAENPDVAAYLEVVEADREAEPTHRRHDRANITFAELRVALSAPKPLDVTPTMWEKTAGAADLTLAAKALLDETDPKLLLQYLRIFIHRAFPREVDHSKLLALAQGSERDLAWAATTALMHVQHPAVRAFALECLPKTTDALSMHAVGILARNFQEGVWHLIEAITDKEMDDYAYHTLGWGVRDILELNPSVEAIGSLLNLYENGPCTSCRFHFVEALHKLDAIPDWMREECLYDAESRLREKAASDFEDQVPGR